MIQIICCSKYPELYSRMMRSAKETATGLVMFSNMQDEGKIRIVESYNLLGACSMADTLVFVHDDVIFLSKGWDIKIKEAFNLGFDVVGAVGSKEYQGGLIFDAGKKHSAGKVAGLRDGKRIVKLMEHRTEIEPVKVLDGMFLATTRDHFVKTGFDWQFDGLFFYDLDFCLSSNCAVIDILISHEKPEALRGVYPPDMRPMTDYSEAFNKKHGLPDNPPIGDQRCDAIAYEDYMKEAACL